MAFKYYIPLFQLYKSPVLNSHSGCTEDGGRVKEKCSYNYLFFLTKKIMYKYFGLVKAVEKSHVLTV